MQEKNAWIVYRNNSYYDTEVTTFRYKYSLLLYSIISFNILLICVAFTEMADQTKINSCIQICGKNLKLKPCHGRFGPMRVIPLD